MFAASLYINKSNSIYRTVCHGNMKTDGKIPDRSLSELWISNLTEIS